MSVPAVFDEDRGRSKLGIGKRTQTHDADVVEIIAALRRSCERCLGVGRVYTPEGAADCPCSSPSRSADSSTG